jgi:hypothetical protein
MQLYFNYPHLVKSRISHCIYIYKLGFSFVQYAYSTKLGLGFY